MGNLIAPKRVRLIGFVADVKHRLQAEHPEDNGDSRIVTIQGASIITEKYDETSGDMVEVVTKTAKVYPVWFGENQIDSFEIGSIMFDGNAVSMDMDICKAGITQFERNGKVEFHAKDFYNGGAVINVVDAVMGSLANVDVHGRELIESKRKAYLASFTAVKPRLNLNRFEQKTDSTTKAGVEEQIAKLTASLPKLTNAGYIADTKARIQKAEQLLATFN